MSTKFNASTKFRLVVGGNQPVSHWINAYDFGRAVAVSGDYATVGAPSNRAGLKLVKQAASRLRIPSENLSRSMNDG